MEKRYPPRERRTSRRILAENLRLIRLQRRIPQDELAHIVGLDRSYLGGVERGARNIALDNLDKIATALGVSVPQLLTEPDTSDIAAHLVEDIRCRIKEEAGVYRADSRYEGLCSLRSRYLEGRRRTLSRSRKDGPT